MTYEFFEYSMSLASSMLVQLQTCLSQFPNTQRWVVALSGGLDSSVLLHVVTSANQSLARPLDMSVIHINHQLSANANQWQQHCEDFAASLGLPCLSKRVNVDKQGRGLEAAARAQRYTVFESELAEDDILLLGQHQDDQAETLLLRLMRGAGVDGLTAMPKIRKVGNTYLFRPLLEQSRQSLLNYAQENHLHWIEDESNHDIRFNRNFIRQQVLPLLESRWQDAKQQLAETTVHLQAAKNLLKEQALEDLAKIGLRQERYGFSVDWHTLKSLTEARRKQALRYCCEQAGFMPPGSDACDEIENQFFQNHSLLTSALVTWPDYPDKEPASAIEIRQFNRRIYLMRQLPVFEKTASDLIWQGETQLSLGAAGTLVLAADQAENNRDKNDQDKNEQGLLIPKHLLDKPIYIRWRQGGERCQPQGRSASQMVKKLLQEYQLETWLRDRVPLLYQDEALMAVGDCWLCTPFAAKPNDELIRIRWII